MEEQKTVGAPVWVRAAQKRASTRTFVVPVDARGRAVLSFWVSQTPRPVTEEDVNCTVAE